jgi:starch phosphorylase
MTITDSDRSTRRVAYFSMEIAIEPDIPTYSGGLGVLAGDTLRSAADLHVPMIGITLVHRKGYFRQSLDHSGNQSESAMPWDPSAHAELMDATACVVLEGRPVRVRAWRYWIKGAGVHDVPVYLLDTDCPENSEWDRRLTDHLYGGDARYRLCQEAILGIGGVKILRGLGHTDVKVFHLNEGHASLLALALLEERVGVSSLGTATEADIDAVRQQCVFTTHTPVPAGHDQFPRALMTQVLGADRTAVLDVTHCCPVATLNMTFLGLRFSHYINGVAMHHGAVSRDMFPQYPIRAITNGVHAVTWSAPSFRHLYDRHIPEWRRDNAYLRYAIGISTDEIWAAHKAAKAALLDAIHAATGVTLNPHVMTLGFARRAAAYKRFNLLLSDPNRLLQICERTGPLQIIYAGKAHPQDAPGKNQIRSVFQHAANDQGRLLKIIYLEDFDMKWGKLLTAGADLWVNTPLRPLEASGTSGMKAAMNGVPSLSVLDGWWIEGCLEGTTGWAIGGHCGPVAHPEETESLYCKLDQIARMFYQQPEEYHSIMRAAIAINGSFFNSQRMLSQYVANAYCASCEVLPASSEPVSSAA